MGKMCWHFLHGQVYSEHMCIFLVNCSSRKCCCFSRASPPILDCKAVRWKVSEVLCQEIFRQKKWDEDVLSCKYPGFHPTRGLKRARAGKEGVWDFLWQKKLRTNPSPAPNSCAAILHHQPAASRVFFLDVLLLWHKWKQMAVKTVSNLFALPAQKVCGQGGWKVQTWPLQFDCHSALDHVPRIMVIHKKGKNSFERPSLPSDVSLLFGSSCLAQQSGSPWNMLGFWFPEWAQNYWPRDCAMFIGVNPCMET